MADGEFETTPAPKSLANVRTGRTMALVPSNVDEAWRIAQAFARSGMCPKGMDAPEQVLVAVMAGAEIGLAPFQAVQSFAVINGRPSLWGDGMLAVVRQFGVQVAERLEGDGEMATAHCKVSRPDTGETIERSFSVADAKAANLWKKAGPWTTYPKRMLQMRARAWALRDGCADMLRGMHMAEEAQDMEVIANEPISDKPFINGAKKDDCVRIWNASFRAATTPEELDATMKLIADYPGRFSDNVMDGLLEVHATEYERICAGEAPRAAEPSPFEALKEEALACLMADDKPKALEAWQRKATAKSKLALCTADERKELKTLEKNIKAAIVADE